MKQVSFYVREKGYKEGNGQAFEVDYRWDKDYPKETFLKHYDMIVATVNRDYPNLEFVEAKIITNPQEGFTRKKLLEIGQEVASVYGAVCTNVKTYTKSVEFQCNEYGEKFTTFMTYEEIKQEYANML